MKYLSQFLIVFFLHFSSISFGQPANNNCIGASQLSIENCGFTTGTLLNATQQLPPVTCDGFTSTNAFDVWYKFTATSQHHNIIAIPSSALDLVIELRGGTCNSTFNLDCQDMGGGSGKIEVLKYHNFTIGQEYFIRIYAFPGAIPVNPIFDIYIIKGDPVSNDFCNGAINLIPNSNCINTVGTIGGATASGLPILSQDICFVPTPHLEDVWFKFTANSNSLHTVTVTPPNCNTYNGFDPVIGIYTSCGGNEWISMDSGGGVGKAESISFNTLIGITYYIRVYDCGSLEPNISTFNICVTTQAACIPVSMAVNPQSQTINSGGTATLNVSVNGTPPFSYFWYKNNIFTGVSTTNTTSTNDSYTTANLFYPNDNGSLYYCLITNCNSTFQAQSQNAIINVNQSCPNPPTTPPTPTPNNPACGTVTLTRSNPPSGQTYYWQGNSCGMTTAFGSNITFQANSSGQYYLRAYDNINACWSNSCSSISVTVNQGPPITASSNSPVTAPTTLQLSVTTVPNAIYSWTGPNGFTSDMQNPSRSPSTSSMTGDYCVAANINGCISNSCTNVVVNIGGACIGANNAQISPINPSIFEGDKVDFSVIVNGTMPFQYQWYRNNEIINGATNSAYTTPILNLNNSGDTYKCIIKNCNNNNTIETANSIISVSNGASVEMLWDFSYPQENIPLKGVAADGVGRLYIKVSKQNQSKIIKNVEINLSDNQNSNSTSTLGKLMPASNIFAYHEEANNANSIIAVNNQSGLNNYWFWYVAPDNFVRVGLNDFNTSKRNVLANVKIIFTDNSVITKVLPIEIVRPPLLMVHGLGGDKEETWNNLKNTNLELFKYDSRFLSKNIINLYTKNGLFSENAKEILNLHHDNLNLNYPINSSKFKNSIQGSIYDLRKQGYACNQCYYLCHSMGGSILRTMYTELNSKYYNGAGPYLNYKKGYINRAITLNSPHRGSSWADLLSEKVDYLNNTLLTADEFFSFGYIANKTRYLIQENELAKTLIKEVYNGNKYYNFYDFTVTDAVKNLSPTTGISFANLNIPTHVIAGDVLPGIQDFPSVPAYWLALTEDQNNILQLFNNLLKLERWLTRDLATRQALDIIIKEAKPFIRALRYIEYTIKIINGASFIFDSDVIVSVKSQLSGLPALSSNSSIYDNIVHNGAIDLLGTSVLNSSPIGSKVDELLHESINSTKFNFLPECINQTTPQLRNTNQIPIYYRHNMSDFHFLDQPETLIANLDSSFNIKVLPLKNNANLSLLWAFFQNNDLMVENSDTVCFNFNLENQNSGIQNFIVHLLYEYPDSTVIVYDTIFINVKPNFLTLSLNIFPDTMYLNKNELKDISLFLYNNQDSINVINTCNCLQTEPYDTSIIKFLNFSNSVIGNKTGTVKLKIKYQAFVDSVCVIVIDTSTPSNYIFDFDLSPNLNIEMCPGDSTTLSVSNLNNVYWLTPQGLDTFNSKNIKVSPLESTTYVAIGFDSLGNSKYKSVNIIVHNKPNILASSNKQSLCKGEYVTLSGNGGINYSWSDAVINNIPFIPQQSKTYVLTGTDENGCIGTSSIDINIIEDTDPPRIICPKDLQLITKVNECSVNAATINLGSFQIITDNCGIKYPLSNNAPSLLNPGINSIKWTVSDIQGNKSTCTQKVTVTPYSCGKPTNLTTSNIASTSFKLNWLAGNCATAYKLRIRVKQANGSYATWSSWQTASGPGLTHQFNNLQAGKYYNYQLRTACGLANSGEVNGFIQMPNAGGGGLSQRNENENDGAQASIEIFPNPAKESCLIKVFGFDDHSTKIRIFNTFGKLIATHYLKVDENSFEIKLTEYNVSADLYLVEVSDEKLSLVEKLIVLD